MGKRKVNLKSSFETWIDHSKLAIVGICELLKKPKYAVFTIFSLVIILFILNFFKDGNSNWILLTSGLDLGRKIEIIGRVFVGIADILTNLYGVAICFMTIMQALILSMIIYIWRGRARDQKNKDAAIDSASTGGIGTILGFIALGCPSCGVGLLTPILTTIAGAGSLALADFFGHFFTVIAFLLLLYTLIKLGYTSFINLSIEKHQREKKHAKSS